MSKFLKVVAIFFIAIGFTLPILSDEGDIEIHGFGSWGMGKTWGANKLKQKKFYIDPTTGAPDPVAGKALPDEKERVNNYQYGRSKLDMSNADFALNISGNPYDNLTIFSQIMFETYLRDTNIYLDYAFMEYMINDFFILRAGKVKQPFGLYNETARVGTIRAFALLPQSVYGNQAMTGIAYKGLGVAGSYYTDSDWGIEYNLYGGSLLLDRTAEYALGFGLIDDVEYGELEKNVVKDYLRKIVGAKLTFNTPYSLEFGLSAFASSTDVARKGTEYDNKMYNLGAFLRFSKFGFEFSSEFVSSRNYLMVFDGEEAVGKYPDITTAFYTILSYRLDKYQIAFMYDFFNYELAPERPASIPTYDGTMFLLNDSKYLDHQDIAIALNYWVFPNLVFKTEYHYVKGLIFARPNHCNGEFYTNFLSNKSYNVGYETTHLLQFIVQFSF